MKASLSIKKFVGKWVNIVLKNGQKITVKIRALISDLYSNAFVQYEVVGSRELRSIAKSDIIEVYA